MHRMLIQTCLAGFFLFIFGLGSTHAQESISDFQARLRGTWKSGCMNVGEGTYIKVTMNFDGAGTSRDRVIFYRDPGCGSPTGLVKNNPSNVYKLGKAKKIGEMTAYPIDITIGSWQLIQDGSVIQSGGPVPTQFDLIAIQDGKLYTSGLTRAHPMMITNPVQRPTTLDMGNHYTR